jgi:23S rRNA pseudouridine2605 synthase
LEEIRLQKYMASSGIASRRKCEEYILAGKVKVNGTIVQELGTKIVPSRDEVEFDGRKIGKEEKFIYILLNKPIGYVTTTNDQFGRDDVLDLVKVKERVVPVGRLDMYTSGALILTNDGDFVYKITHPKHEINKTYTVTLKGIITKDEVINLQNGVDIGDYITKPAKVKILKTDEEKQISRLEIVIHEGKNRQVRRMCEAVGRKVLALHRTKIGDISVKDIELGKWRYLKKDEVQKLKLGANKI